MVVLRLDRGTIDPADTAQKLTRHAAVVAAAKGAFPSPSRSTTPCLRCSAIRLRGKPWNR